MRISDAGKLHLLTNCFDLSAEEISEMYKSRWAIELFFKWIKQHLSIKNFYGQSEWAIHNQVFIALIAFCLHVLIQLETESNRKTLQTCFFPTSPSIGSWFYLRNKKISHIERMVKKLLVFLHSHLGNLCNKPTLQTVPFLDNKYHLFKIVIRPLNRFLEVCLYYV